MKLQNFATDESLEEQGVWVNLGNGVEVKVARMGNSAHKAEWRKLQQPHLKEIRLNTLDEETARDLALKALSRTILLDWSGIKDVDGKEVEYSEENAYEALRDNRDFRNAIEEIASEREAFKEELEEDSQKNS